MPERTRTWMTHLGSVGVCTQAHGAAAAAPLLLSPAACWAVCQEAQHPPVGAKMRLHLRAGPGVRGEHSAGALGQSVRGCGL